MIRVRQLPPPCMANVLESINWCRLYLTFGVFVFKFSNGHAIPTGPPIILEKADKKTLLNREYE